MSQGTVDFREGVFAIRCEPHIALRLKRTLPKIDKQQMGTLTVKATPEVARDLEWFAQRYSITLDPAVAEFSKAHREKESLVARILADNYKPPKFKLAKPARQYQKQAAALHLANGGLLLADEVGLGKTCSAICTFMDPRTLPAVVVTLTHLPGQWLGEIKKFSPKLHVHVVKLGTPYDMTVSRRQRVPTPDVIILNYHKLAGWAETLAKFAKSVVYDECQELRHTGTNRYAGAFHLSSEVDFCMGLSATPFYNYGGEFFNVNECISPGSLGERDEFLREWCTWDDKPQIKDPRAFGMYVREAGIMLRRTRAQVRRELPSEPVPIPVHVNCNTSALDAIEERCAELARIILGKEQQYKGEKMQAASELDSAIRMATGIGKAPYVAEFVNLLLEAEQKIVLFGWHREVYDIWMSVLKQYNPVMYTGSESPAQKNANKLRFINDPTCRLMIISLRSGAGLDGLQAVCRTTVHGELDWSPGVHEQNIGRVNRDGQKEVVMPYFCISDGGSDPLMAQTLGVKKQQIKGVNDPDSELIESLQVDVEHVRKLAEDYLRRANTNKKSRVEEAMDELKQRIGAS